jgi:hypothetical protein
MSSIVKGVKGIIGGITGSTGAKAAEQAGQAQLAGTQAATAEQRRQFDITQGQLEPFREAGLGALEQQQALLGLLGPGQQQTALGSISQSPAQRFIEDRAQRNLIQNQSALGGLGGGNIRSALVEQGAGFAGGQLQNQFSQLGQIAGQGQAAGTNIAQLGGQTSGNIANLLQAGGQATASGILGAQQARSAGTQQLLGAGLGAAAGGGLFGAGAAGLFGGSAGGGALLGLLSDMRFKTNINKIGELDSGIGWYEWEWTDDAPEGRGLLCVGVLAQEVQHKMPEAVIEHDGYLRVNYEVLH